MSDYRENLKKMVKSLKSQMFRVGVASTHANDELARQLQRKIDIDRYCDMSDKANLMLEDIFTLIDNNDTKSSSQCSLNGEEE